MRQGAQGGRRAFAVVEVLAVAATIAILLGLGFSVYRGARKAAVVAEAENDLKQISSAFQLYFNRYGSYPQQGADLATELGPFARNPEVFINPAKEESKPGQTLSLLYREPILSELDAANTYVTSLPIGNVLLILRTSGGVDKVELEANLDSDAAAELLIEQLTGERQLRGGLNINPRNNHDFEFNMRIGDGREITRDHLLASKGSLFYEGKAIYIKMNPKGNGNKNTIRISGRPFEVENGTIYVIEDPEMQVKLWNMGAHGASMGRWWLDLNASAPKITLMSPSGEVIQVITGLTGN